MRTRWSCLLAVAVLPALAGCAGKSTNMASGCCKGPCKMPTKADTAAWAKFGEPLKLSDADTVCASTVLAEPQKYAGKYVRLCGQVDSVCAAKGCWLRLAGPDQGETLFVKFTCPVSGRLVPMAAVGHRALVEGTFEVSEISEEVARHYAADQDAPPAEIAKIVGPQKQLALKSPGAMVEGVTAAAPQGG